MHRLHVALSDPTSRAFHYVNDGLALLTILSIVALILETVPGLAEYRAIFTLIEWVAVGFFTLEYVARLLVSRPAWRYPLSFFGVIDLVSIAPTLLGLGNFTFLKSARALRLLRLLRMLRLAKLARTDLVDEAELGVLPFNVLLYAVALLFALIVTGTALYLVEPDAAAFTSIPAGMWWSLKVFLGSITVYEPITPAGEVLYVVTRFAGLLLFGLLVGVVGNVFRAVVMGDLKQ